MSEAEYVLGWADDPHWLPHCVECGVVVWDRAAHTASHSVTPLALLSPDDLAKYLGLALVTLAKWRQRGTGPKWIKAGNAVRYEWGEVQRWIKDGGDR